MGTETIKLKSILEADATAILSILMRTVEPDSWQRLGGSGAMKLFRVPGAPSTNTYLIVWHTLEVRDEIKKTLEKLGLYTPPVP